MTETLTQFDPPSTWYDRLAVTGEWEDVDGIPVKYAVFNLPEAARQRLTSAIRLLIAYSASDADRCRRLCRGLIVARTYTSCGQWRPSLQACIIDVDYLESQYSSPEAVAAVIVHEVTHARLDKYGFDYDQEVHRGRIERICCLASQRFLGRLPESDEREIAIGACEDYVRLDPPPWTDAAYEASFRSFPWYWRIFRFIAHDLPRRMRHDLPT